MIQRIQSVYLLFVLLFGVLTLFLLLEIHYNFETEVRFNTIYGFLLSPTLTLLIILFYKKRQIQAYLCIFNILILFLQLIVFVLSLNFTDDFMFNEMLIFLNSLGIFLLWFARHNIVKDEALVRSVDRIR